MIGTVLIILTERILFQKIYKKFCDFFLHSYTFFSTVVTVTATAEAAMRVTATATAGEEERVTDTAMTRVTTVTATGVTATARKLAVVR